jgi:hypothetical protein
MKNAAAPFRYNRALLHCTRALLTLLAVCALALATVRAQVVVRTFDDEAAGALPSGFLFATARQAVAGRWVVRADGPGQHLVHLADTAASGGFSLAVLEKAEPAHVRLSVRLKLSDGERVGGLVWRYQDAQNFYLVALDLRAQDLALYRVVRGNRVRLEDEDDLELDPSAWHSVRVVHDEDDIRVSLGGIGVMRARDRTFAAGGRAGVWSGGAATAWFDDLRVEPEAARERAR